MRNKEKTKSNLLSAENKEVTKRLFKYIFKDTKLKFFFVLILVVISSFVGVASSLFIKVLIDDYIVVLINQGTPDYAPLISLLIKMGIIYAIGILSTLTYSRMMVDITEVTLRDMRNDLFAHLQKLPISYFDTNSHGDIMSHFTNDIQVLERMIADVLPGLFSSIMTILAVGFAMIYSSIILTVVVFITLIFLILVMKNVSKKSSKYFLKQQQMIGKTNGYIEEMIDGQKVVKVFSHEENIIDEFNKINSDLAENTMLANRYSLYLIPIVFNIGNLQYAFIAIIGGLLAISGKFGITVGTIAAFLQLSKSFGGPMRNISQQMNQLIMSLAGAVRIFDLFDEVEEEDNGNIELVRICKDDSGNIKECSERTDMWAWKDIQDEKEVYTELKGDIRFKNVNFSYDGENDVLHDISLFAKPGQKLAFVGETGAGKTTITNLINRFYEIQSGTITYDGIDIKNIKKRDLRKSLGMVLQDTNLFTGTINYNLSYGNPDASSEKIIEGAKKVQANHFIELLPDGYNTRISGTVSDLSQGQSQLLSIGRTEIYNPPVLILDEATSSIDSRTEKLVQESMNEVMVGRTTFVIAHRLSTVRDADAIIVLSKGKIIERGSHDELLEQKGVYYKLYTSGLE